MTPQDSSYMQWALDLAEQGRGATAPNPMVGAVAVQDGSEAGGAVVVGEGYHARAGAEHAEAVALRAAGDQARNATLYVTLEPCQHHGRTPPCTEAIIAAGVSRVVVAQLDPDEKMRGKSIEFLRSNGIEVEVGVREDDARRQNEAYLHHRATGRPFFVLKLALTIDGRIGAPDGSSQWITSEVARADAHLLRAASDAILVGSGTVLADNPRLTVRTNDETAQRQPLRVVGDGRGRTPPTAAVFAQPGEVVIATTQACRPVTQEAWAKAGANVVQLPAGHAGGVDIGALAAHLADRDVLQVLVEGGAILAGELLRRGLVDKLIVYVGAALAGGDTALSAFGGPAFASIGDFARFQLLDVTRFSDDVRLEYLPRPA